jgi:oxygen-independent coproporphyrinogen-3 oxidase
LHGISVVQAFVKLQSLSGIYLHIPFCKQACHYCNFHFSTRLQKKEALLQSMFRELKLIRENLNDLPKIETIYFGGGTPSLLEDDELTQFLEQIHQRYDVDPDAEITLEVNPDDLSEHRLNRWLRDGFNRLSVGIQSFDEDELNWMNRAHNRQQALDGLSLIHAAGFTNFSADLIFGSPFQSDETLLKNLAVLIDHRIPHLSCYGLTLEEGTAYAVAVKRKKDIPVANEQQARQFHLVMDRLLQAGYVHYEISNYAKPGFESKHNSSYWKGKPYLGFGPSAHSFDGNKTRSWNVANNSLYIQQLENNQLPSTAETLSTREQFNEMIMISLRLSSGINLQQLKSTFGNQVYAKLMKAAEIFSEKKWLIQSNDDHLMLTREGKLYADHIASELFWDEDV